MEVILGAVIAVVAIYGGVRLLVFAVRMVGRLFDHLENWF